MASHGGGNKFVSVNLNKSFGQSSSYNHYNRLPHYINNNGSYGQATTGRIRPGGGGAGGGAGGGDGMVVLSRPRSSQKVAPKLSVPPPLNLPSMRKEHEKFDLSGSGSGLAGGSGTGSGSRPNLSGVGWTKPGAVALQEKDVSGDALVADRVDQSAGGTDGAVAKRNSSYMPPSARLMGVGVPSGQSYVRPADKAMVLTGEDFPSLKAALPTTSGPSQKQRDNLNQKQKQGIIEESSNEQRDYDDMHSPVHMRPQGQYNYSTTSNGSIATGGQGRRPDGSSKMANMTQKHEDYPLPLVRFNPRSDWADDERDTRHVTADWGRDNGLTRSEAYWDRDFDIPRTSVIPQKSSNSTLEKQGLNDFAKGPSSDVQKVDPFRRSGKTLTHEGNNWRTTPLQNVGFNRNGVSASVNVSSQPAGLSRDNGRENRYVPPHLGDSARDSGLTGIRESAPGRKDTRHGQEGRQHWNNMVETSNQRSEQKDRFLAEQSVRYMNDAIQYKTISKFSTTSGNKGLSVNDPILNFSRQKLHLPKSDRPYFEDPLLKDIGSTGFDENDHFSGGIVGVVKRKKEVIIQVDLHDPVRESFEAELERVQKMQEMERQRIIEEQERILEQARREEEERLRIIREEEERLRRLEEEAQEAAWKAEQERLEVIRMAEEQKIAREEEKRRISLEEERRKHAANQKLLELEARIAQRCAESENSDISFAAVQNEKISSGMKEKDVIGEADLDDWEDSERMVERITTSASSDSSARNRLYVTSSRLPPLVKSSSGFLERGKTVNAWRKDVFENVNSSSLYLQDQDNAHLSPRRDAFVGEKAIMRKESYGGAGFSNAYSGVGMQETHLGEYTRTKENKWNLYKDGDPFNKNRVTGSESYENVSERYDAAAWGQGHTGRNPYSAYPEHLYPNDELYSYGRSRYSMKQPRVLPPPSIKSSFRGENDHPGPSSSLGVDTPYSYVARSESALQTGYYDESDESGDSPAMPASVEEKVIPSSENNSIVLNKSGKDIIVTASGSITAGEDEEWTLNKNEKMQEQEEYDEDGYQEEDEVHEVDDENNDMTSEFKNMHLDEKDSSDMIDNLVLGFDEGVEVKLPNDDFDRNLNSEGNNCEIPEVSIGIVEDQGSVDEKQGGLEKLQPVDCFPQTDAEFASGRIGKTEQTTQETVMQPINDPPTSVVCDLLNDTNTSSSGISSVSTASSPVHTASQFSCRQPITSVASYVPNPADLPVKLQFGLFAGPSLIPSPVPSIQIGSIQMPLHLHLPLDPSIPHLHTSQPPLFQFGQLGYTSPVSHGILPMPPQSMSLLQPNVQHNYNANQNSVGSTPNQSEQHRHTHNLIKDKVSSFSMNSQSTVVSKTLDISDENRSGVMSSFPGGSADGSIAMHITGIEVPHAVNNHMSNSVSQAEDNVLFNSVIKNVGQSNAEGPQVQLRSTDNFVSCEKGKVSKGEVPFTGNKEKQVPYLVRNGGRSFSSQDSSYSDSRAFQRRPRREIQRTEFRVRQSSSLFPSKNSGLDDKSNSNGTGEVPTRSGYKRGTMIHKSLKQVTDSGSLTSDPISSKEIDSDRKVARERGKDALPKSRGILFSREGNMKMNLSEEDVDAPSQSGVVHVFKQSGIEAPSDEDDFIEVRSKRQMLNDRREQREKEIKAKSQATKLPRKPRSSAQICMVSTSSNKNYVSVGGGTSNNTQIGAAPEGQGKEVSIGSKPMTSQQLAPVGTPTLNTDSPADFRPHNMSFQAAAVPIVSGGGKENGRGLIYENKNKVLDTVQTPLGSWGNSQISQQVMALTQNQLDEAMKPARFETHVASTGGHTTSEIMLASSSSLIKDKPILSSASPINSLLAGEKIQFGAVTSPTVLPPSTSRVTSFGIEAPGSLLSNIKMSQNISRDKSSSPLLLEKDKCFHESCGQLKICEDKVEAAASAVAVVAVSSDNRALNGLCPVSISDAKNFGNADVSGIVEGVSDDQQSRIQSRVEESLSVSLPADLSVETPPISSWPPLPSPQHSSSQMLSHFPVAPPSHFPFYEMNPMLGGPIFAFSPVEESGRSHPQSQKDSVSGPGSMGTWQQCHPTMDSFYGTPAGYSGPLINPSGGVPGVQSPPQMLVYNHYARVGQFGQVGLSFMGTAYIPSGKQPDWKHNPTSSGMGIIDGDRNNMNMVSAQRNPPNIPAPMQHLAPGPPILPMPMASPMAMFDVSPFQSAPDISVQGRWSHVPASPLPTLPITLPLQQQRDGVSASQFHHGHPVEQLRAGFSESQTSALSDSRRTFPVAADTRHPHSPGELGLVDTSSCISAGTSTNIVTHQSSSESVTANTDKSEAVQNGSSNTSSGHNMNSFKPQHSQQKNLSSQQYNNPTSYGYQRGGASQKNSSAGEWSHRRMGFHGRNHSLGAEKTLPNSKVRQIYVAKQTNGSSSAD